MKDAVDTVSQLKRFLERLDVDVARARLHSPRNDQVDHPDDRRFRCKVSKLVDVVVGQGVPERFDELLIATLFTVESVQLSDNIAGRRKIHPLPVVGSQADGGLSFRIQGISHHQRQDVIGEVNRKHFEGTEKTVRKLLGFDRNRRVLSSKKRNVDLPAQYRQHVPFGNESEIRQYFPDSIGPLRLQRESVVQVLVGNQVALLEQLAQKLPIESQ